MVSTVDTNAVGLGADILYQSYFVCVKEGSKSTVIEYGKSHGTTESGDVYLTMIDRVDPLYVRFYSFGNGEEPMEVVDAHIISRHLTKANCRGDTVLDNQTNMCVQNCHIQCDPTQGNIICSNYLTRNNNLLITIARNGVALEFVAKWRCTTNQEPTNDKIHALTLSLRKSSFLDI